MHRHFRHTHTVSTCRFFWVRSFIEPGLSDNNVPFGNTFPIYLISLHWKLGLRLVLHLELHYFSIVTENENEHLSYANFTEGNTLLKEGTQTMNNKIKLHIIGVLMNKVGN